MMLSYVFVITGNCLGAVCQCIHFYASAHPVDVFRLSVHLCMCVLLRREASWLDTNF